VNSPNGSIADLLQALAGALPEVAPPDLLEIETQRSMRDRLSGKPGQVVQVRLTGPELTLTLAAPEGRRPVTEVAHVVRGVVISRRTVPVSEWLEQLAGQLRELAALSNTDDAAVSRALSALGLRPPGSDLMMDDDNPVAGLQALPARLAGRVPDDVLATVERIGAALLEILPRTDPGSQSGHLVTRTATDYLPRTLREYLALPAGWAAEHQLESGGTALDALREQLALLETGTNRMRDAALAADAGQLLANGSFLQDRFGTSGLDH
jgi:hypothetical protein